MSTHFACRRKIFKILGKPVCAALTAVCGGLLAGDAAAFSEYPLPELGLEELMEVKVTSVAKKSQKLSEAPSAIYVITQEKIRRSGATSLPELLRMVPGVHVARIDADKWSVSIRGFSGEFANKLLVSMDGRTLYDPLFAGVFWGEQDIVLEDIERIEIIRGPGASLWGANAVNGVIDIITKNAVETRYGRFAAHAGNTADGVSLRHGSALDENTQARAYFKYNRHQDAKLAGGEPADTEADAWHAGGRLDTLITEHDSLSVWLDLRDGESERKTTDIAWLAPPSIVDDTNKFSGVNLMSAWRHDSAPGKEIRAKVYIDRTERENRVLKQHFTLFDIDLQRRFPVGDRHDFMWGLNYTKVEDDLQDSFAMSFEPVKRTSQVGSLFVQDEIRLRETFCLTLGSKFEHNDYSSFEYQPSVRALWNLQTKGMVWGALSRAVHTPSRFDHDSRLNVASRPGDPPVLISLLSDGAFEAEDLLAWEGGWRGHVGNKLALDIAAFYHRYSDLRTREVNPPRFEHSPPPPHLLISTVSRNLMAGENHGLELTLAWQVRSNWRLETSGQWLYSDMRVSAGSGDEERIANIEGNSPNRQFKLQSYWKPAENLELDAFYHYSAALPFYDLPAYTRLDLRLGWQARNSIEFNLVVHNLLDDRHVEYESTEGSIPAEMARSVHGELIWRF